MADKKHYLLIAEKPDLMRKIQACYEKHRDKIPYKITFTAQRGHLVTLKYPDEIDESLKEWSWDTLPINPKEHGGWQYKVIEEKKTGNFMTSRERYDLIKKEIFSGKYDGIINAGDPDREGEFLVRLVLTHCKNRLPIKRFWTNDLTESHILNALLNLRDDENDPQLVNLLNEAYGRQHADYLFGMNLSRAGTLKMGARVACGRVKTPILAIVCEREKAIREFTPRTMYGVKAYYEEGFDGVLIGDSPDSESDENGENDEEGQGNGVKWFDSRAEAAKLAGTLKRSLRITKCEKKRQSSYAPKLFKLATAQIEAGKMGYGAADTLRILQGLYEKKLLSYPRSGCEYLGGDEDFEDMIKAAGCVPELRKYTDSISAGDITRVRKTKTWINAEELKKEGHSAIVPTGVLPDWPELDKEEQDIYRMVCRQFVAPFLPPLVQDRTTLVAETEKNSFRSTGKTLVDPGWTAAFGKNHTDVMIPEHQKGDVLLVSKYDVTEKTTQCPSRYTTADLISICENPIKHLDDKKYKKLGKRLKIGTPATRAGIIEELVVTDKYMKKVKEGRREVVVPTKTGEEIIENINDCAICKVDLTGEWEEQLEKVRSGELSLKEIDDYMMEHVTEQVEEFRNRNMRMIDAEGRPQRIGTCPFCGGVLMRGPTMYYCTRYKDGCKAGGAVEKNGAVISIDEFLEMTSGKTVVKKMTKNGKTWDQKVSCNMETGRIVYPGEYADSGYVCPVCGDKVLESPVALVCSGRAKKTCGVFMSKHFVNKDIPDEELRDLFTKGKTGVIKGIVSAKTKDTYDVYFTVDREAKKIVPKYISPEIDTDYACPVCGRALKRKGFRYICSGTGSGKCGFSMPATMSKEDIPDTVVKRLLDAVKTGKVGGRDHAFTEKGETDFRCPCCGSRIAKDGMWYVCGDADCGFRVYRLMNGHILTDAEAESLFSKKRTETITDFISKKTKKEFSAALVVDTDEKKTGFDFEDVKSESKYKCPLCGKRMSDSGMKISCVCGLSVWKKQGGRMLTEKDLDSLMTKGYTGFLKLKGQDGKPFEAKIMIDPEEKRTKYGYKPKSRNI